MLVGLSLRFRLKNMQVIFIVTEMEYCLMGLLGSLLVGQEKLIERCHFSHFSGFVVSKCNMK